MSIENSIWYKTISLRSLALIWFCWGLFPLALREMPKGFEQNLLFVFLVAIGILTVYSFMMALSKKNLIGIVLYGVVPIFISVASYFIAGNG